MTPWRTRALRSVAITLPLAAGAAVIVLSTASKAPPQPKPAEIDPVAVRVITLAETAVVPRVSGYGSVKPAREWRAVARVEGEVAWISDSLANGLLAEAGDELLKIDDSDIRLTLAQTDAQLASLDVKDQTTRASLRVSEEALALARSELERTKELASRAVASQAAVEQAESQEIAARAAVVSLENQLAINAVERDVLMAQRAVTARSLEYVSIAAPFAIRIGEVEAQLGQFVSRGQTLFSADGVDTAEIAAQFPIGRLAPLVRRPDKPDAAAGPLGLEAVVRLYAPDHLIEWPARVDRVGDVIDPKTQSAAVVVAVDQPLAMARPGERPPLRRNMFVEVELRAPERPALVIPAGVMRDGNVMVVDDAGRLEQRAVETAFSADGVIVVSSGLSPGDRLVVSELEIPVSGMSVTPVEDDALKARLDAIALNQE